MKDFLLILFLSVLVFGVGLTTYQVRSQQSSETYYQARCPICHQQGVSQEVGAGVVTNEAILMGTKSVKWLTLKCPKCGREFKARSEVITPYVEAMEIKLPEKVSQPEIPPPVPWAPEPTNMVLMTAPSGRGYLILHASDLDLQFLIDSFQTNRSNLNLVIQTKL
jgi:endogenous inhibitor of DNA gyrase (YacG/DUF329 family)